MHSHTQTTGFTPLQKILLILAAGGLGVAGWYFMQARGSTTLGVELTRPSAGCPNVGDLCPDGTYFLGTTPDNGLPLFLADSSSEVTTRWNNGNTSGYVTTGLTSTTDGDGHTETLLSTDSDNISAGSQPHLAAQYCADLAAHAHTDWYLPALDELDVVWNSGSVLGDVKTDGTYYLSSTEINNTLAYIERFSDGLQNSAIKSNFTTVRCVRSGTAAVATGAQTISTNPSLSDGLVGHWTFDGQDVDWASTTAEIKDRSGNGNHGNALGGMTMATSPTMGVLGQGMRFDGNSSVISVSDLKSDVTSLPVTVSVWVYVDDNASQGFFDSANVDDRYAGAYLFTAATGQVTARFGDANTIACSSISRNGATSVSALPEEQWVHLVAVYRGYNDFDIYFNAVAQSLTYGGDATQLKNGVAGAGSVGYVEFCGASVDPYTTGNMDDLRVYNRTLSANEIRRLYDLGR
ncbi:MAG: hypothetical protein KDE45_00170 [Caldilineaceae bacterium]|nr:hypothetical protein [Caldilineaceae bacterium]